MQNDIFENVKKIMEIEEMPLEQADPQEEPQEKKEDPLPVDEEGTKEYFGKTNDGKFFYLVVKGNNPVIMDALGKEVYKGETAVEKPEGEDKGPSMKEFIQSAAKELKIEALDANVVDKYITKPAEEELKAEEMTIESPAPSIPMTPPLTPEEQAREDLKPITKEEGAEAPKGEEKDGEEKPAEGEEAGVDTEVKPEGEETPAEVQTEDEMVDEYEEFLKSKEKKPEEEIEKEEEEALVGESKVNEIQTDAGKVPTDREVLDFLNKDFHLDKLTKQEVDTLLRRTQMAVAPDLKSYFWNREYRHYLRDASASQLRKVRELLTKAGLPLDGQSDEHLKIIQQVVSPEELQEGIVNENASPRDIKLRNTLKALLNANQYSDESNAAITNAYMLDKKINPTWDAKTKEIIAKAESILAESKIDEARTIGPKGKKLVAELVAQAQAKGMHGINEISDYVIQAMPQAFLDSWEGAYTEIENLAMDIVMGQVYGTKKNESKQNLKYKVGDKVSYRGSQGVVDAVFDESPTTKPYYVKIDGGRAWYSDKELKSIANESVINEKLIAYNVILNGDVIDTVFYREDQNIDEEEIKKSLVNHDGYDPNIVVKKEEKASVKTEEPTEDDAADTEKGRKIAELLGLRKKGGRYNTTWGTKTEMGLYRSIKRILEESKKERKLNEISEEDAAKIKASQEIVDKAVQGNAQKAEEPKNAKCEICSLVMSPNNEGCFAYAIDGEGAVYRREAYGEEGGPTDEPCHDCNVKGGGFHHYGCDNEYCPKCGEQFAFCDCDWVKLTNVRPKGVKKAVNEGKEESTPKPSGLLPKDEIYDSVKGLFDIKVQPTEKGK